MDGRGNLKTFVPELLLEAMGFWNPVVMNEEVGVPLVIGAVMAVVIVVTVAFVVTLLASPLWENVFMLGLHEFGVTVVGFLIASMSDRSDRNSVRMAAIGARGKVLEMFGLLVGFSVVVLRSPEFVLAVQCLCSLFTRVFLLPVDTRWY